MEYAQNLADLHALQLDRAGFGPAQAVELSGGGEVKLEVLSYEQRVKLLDELMGGEGPLEGLDMAPMGPGWRGPAEDGTALARSKTFP